MNPGQNLWVGSFHAGGFVGPLLIRNPSKEMPKNSFCL
jgi:hypothetical protein